MTISFFDINFDGNIIEPKLYSRFYLKQILLQNTDCFEKFEDFDCNIIFINSEKDITNNRIDAIADKTQEQKPTLIIGTSKLEWNEIEKDNQKKSFLDSSVWVKYVHEQATFDETCNVIKSALQEIKHAQHIYKSKVGKEFIELNSRICKNSMLNVDGGHGENISPFVFHSETVMQEKAEKELAKLLESGLKWSALLVDDFAEKPLATIHKADEGSSLSKREIIENILYPKSDDEDSKIIVASDCKISDAIIDLIIEIKAVFLPEWQRFIKNKISKYEMAVTYNVETNEIRFIERNAEKIVNYIDNAEEFGDFIKSVEKTYNNKPIGNKVKKQIEKILNKDNKGKNFNDYCKDWCERLNKETAIISDACKLQCSIKSIIENPKELTSIQIRQLLGQDTKLLEITSVYSKEELQKEDEKNSKDKPKSSDVVYNLIWKTLVKLSEKTYDIILLDYLLGDSKRPYVDREYSHQLLNIVNNIFKEEAGYGGKKIDGNISYEEILLYHPDYYDKKGKEIKTDVKINKIIDKIEKVVEGIKAHKGPLNKFWIINISSFQTAFLDKMREQGLGHNNPNWTLSRGGDPVNTPQLFRYGLYRLMRLQQKSIMFNVDDILSFFDANPIPDDKKQPGNIDIRDYKMKTWSRNVFGCFISRFYSREMLDKDKTNKSKFAETAIDQTEKKQDIKRAYNLVEHLRHLLYILAFDPGSSMPLALQQLDIVRRKLQGEEFKKMETMLFSKIEQYCIRVIDKHR
ncbi:MAG: hypothetical protein ACOC22_03655 [bacterium]